jgi:hypothetical protein|uniref:hypothetical protein n=1 Tax=Prevotella sp. TaxID=59823 RepID=UPI003FEE7A84
MKKYIDVTKEVRQDIMAAFKVTGKMVYYALNFDAKRGESEKAKRIRVYAKQKGGVVMVVTPEVETIHDANGYMRQYFPNGAMIECNKANGNVDVFYKGQKMKSYEDVKIKELEEIQSIYSLWTQRDADIWTNPELRMKYARACAAK